jgi:hypothetical protein
LTSSTTFAVAIESASRFKSACVSVSIPVEVLEDHHQRLAHRRAEHDALDRIEGPALLDLPIHLGERINTVDNPKQREQIRDGVFERPIDIRTLPPTIH